MTTEPVFFWLVVAALSFTLASAMSKKAPLWVPMLLVIIMLALLNGRIP